MSAVVSSSTPGGRQTDCTVCGTRFWAKPTWPARDDQFTRQITTILGACSLRIPDEPSRRRGDVPCPRCGTLVWIGAKGREEIGPSDRSLTFAVEQEEFLARLKLYFERIERSLTQWVIEGVHAGNIEQIAEFIAQVKPELERLETENRGLIPADQRDLLFGMFEQLEAMIQRDTENKRARFRAEQHRYPPPVRLTRRHEPRDPVLDRSHASGLPPRRRSRRPTTTAGLINWIRVTVQANPDISYGTVYDRWLDG